MSGVQLTNDILAACSHGGNRLFRINAGGIAWQGQIVERSASHLLLAHPRQIHLAPAGYPDLSGWSELDGVAVFSAVEVKAAGDRARPDQTRFIELVLRSGGRAGLARSVEEAQGILKAPIRAR